MGNTAGQFTVNTGYRNPETPDSDYIEHRRRIYTESKAKVVASVWGADFSQFLAALGI